MGEVKCLFVRTTPRGVQELQRAVHETLELPGFALEPLLKLYVPDRFILGYFKQVEPFRELPQGGLMLRLGQSVYFSDAGADIGRLQYALDEMNVEVVKEVGLSEAYVDKLAQSGRKYVEAEAEIIGLATDGVVRKIF